MYLYISVNYACESMSKMYIYFSINIPLGKKFHPHTHEHKHILGLVNRAGDHTSISLKCLQLKRAALKNENH